MKQIELPPGIAYGFHEFPESHKEGKFYKGGLEGKALAAIPRRDWPGVQDGAELLTIFGQNKIKGTDDCSMNTKNGYLHIGFLIEKLEFKFKTFPTVGCIRCGSYAIDRTAVQFVPGTTTNEQIAFMDRVNCSDCLMWWEDPHVDNWRSTTVPALGAGGGHESWDDVDAQQFLNWHTGGY